MANTTKDVTGERFGRLVCIMLAPLENGAKRKKWECKCDCGNTHYVQLGNLRNKSIQSCGCLQKQTRIINGQNRLDHGHSIKKSKTYTTWEAMRDRCNNPNSDWYHRYGGRGIKVCERWNDFNNFLEDMGERPENKTIERLNNDGNYEPNNCKWATALEQATNRG